MSVATTNVEPVQPKPVLSPQMQIIVSMVVSFIAQYVAKQGWTTSAQFTVWANDLITFAIGDGIPAAAAIYAAVRLTYSKLTKDVASQDNVDHVAMKTAQDAAKLGATGTSPPDKILTPLEVIEKVADKPEVHAVVMVTEMGAAASQSQSVVGPSVLKPS